MSSQTNANAASVSDAPKEFTYPALPSNSLHVRLLTLYPSTEETSRLKCRLTSVAIDTFPAFKALSYRWGPPERTHTLLVETTSQDQSTDPAQFLTLGITASLDEALRHLRDPKQDLTLWIDQICINQANDVEKTEQVCGMSTVYARAEEVLIWLGPAESDSDKIMDVWEAVGREARSWGLETYLTRDRLRILWSMMKSPDAFATGDLAEKARSLHSLCATSAARFLGKKSTLSVQEAEPEDLTVLKAMLAWYRRLWFTRVWVMQEYALNQNPIFVCGHKYVEARLVVLATQIFDCSPTLKIFYHTTASGQPGAAPAERVALRNELYHDTTQAFALAHRRHHKFLEGTNPGHSLLDLLRRLYVSDADWEFEATDPRDRIYGLLGLAVDAKDLGIIPDYSECADAARVYSTATRAILQKPSPHVEDEYLLDILSLVRFPKRGADALVNALPSWAPDFVHIRPSFCDRLLSSVRPPPFFCPAGPGRRPRILVTTGDDRILGLEGILVDEIVAVGAPWLGNTKRSQFEAYQTYFNDVSELCDRSAQAMRDAGGDRDPIYPTRARRTEAVWRVLIGDIEETPDDRSSQRATEASEAAARRFAETNELHLQPRRAAPGSWSQADMEEWVRKVRARQAEPENALEGIFDSRLRSMADKRPFMTKIGYVGMAPKVSQVSDIVVVLFGSQVPFVLRPHLGSPKGYYTLLGEAYCDGIMDGEVLQPGNTRSDAFYLV